jgi:16S rRNA processing protein RimM
VRVGGVGRPHGVAGAFLVAAPTERLSLLDPGASLRVAGTDREVTWRGGTPARPLLRLAGIEDRDAAEALRGEALEVSRDQFGPLGEGEHLVRDLIGCVVMDGERRVGVVGDVLTLPSVDCLEVERDDRPGADPVLVPLIADAVRSLDVQARRIDVDLSFVEPE